MSEETHPLTPLHGEDRIRILPLGGLGEIGLNLMVVECNGALVLIDCGLMFPEAYMPGIDLVIPDVSVLEARRDDIRAILLTHGHEDHIGAIPFLLERLGFPPIYGTALTLGLLRGKLEEHHLLSRTTLETLTPRQCIDLTPFTVEFFRVTHSIADGVGIALRTPAGLIVHSGDFKLDPTPIDGEITDLARLATYGEEGVLLLMADSTNVEREGHTLSERMVGEALQQLVGSASGRILVATFASNIHRIQQILNAAVQAGRWVHVSGRSMLTNIAIARQLGYLRAPDGLFVDQAQMRDLPREHLLVLTTGSQGEPLSALSRIAMDDHKQIKITPGDTVILSSKFIPGNERAITDLINLLYRRGAEVHYETTSEIHVSGHASQEELKLVHSLLLPRYFVPVHGEYRHLVKHARLAETMGVEEGNAVVLNNGEPLILSRNGLRREERVEAGRIFVDGKGVGDVGVMELRDRRHLAQHGLVMVLLAINRSSGALLHGPELFSRGFVPEEEGQEILDEAAVALHEMLAEQSLSLLTDSEELRVEVRKTLRRFFNRRLERRPLILPMILEL